MYILTVLMILFMASTVFHGLVFFAGRRLQASGSRAKSIRGILLGGHTRVSIEEMVEERYQKPAILLLWIRNISFLLLVILSLAEYIS